MTKKKPKTARRAMAIAGTRKTLCHPRAVTMPPHTTGAKAGPKVIVQLPMDMKVPSLFFGVTARIVFIIMGMKMPVPIAWMRRAMSRSVKFGARKPRMEPAKLSAEAEKNRVRSLKRR